MNGWVWLAILALPAVALAGAHGKCTHDKTSCTKAVKMACTMQKVEHCPHAQQMATGTPAHCPYVTDRSKYVSLEHALHAAATSLPEALPVEVSYEFSNEGAWYEVELLHDGKLKELDVCATSGKVSEPRLVVLDRHFAASGEAGHWKRPKLTMSQALQRASAHHPHSRPLEAELELEDDRLVFEVRLLWQGEMKEVLLDAQSGTFLTCACDGKA